MVLDGIYIDSCSVDGVNTMLEAFQVVSEKSVMGRAKMQMGQAKMQN